MTKKIQGNRRRDIETALTEVSNRFRDERSRRELSQTSMAQILGVAQSDISKIEEQRKTPSLAVFLKFSIAFEYWDIRKLIAKKKTRTPS